MTNLPTDPRSEARRDRPPGESPKPHTGSAASELTPEQDPNRWEFLVARISARARPILEARRRQHSLARTLADWRRPVLTTAGGLAGAAMVTLLLLPGQDGAPAEASLAEVMIPWSVAAWIDGSYTPTVEELVQAVEEYAP